MSKKYTNKEIQRKADRLIEEKFSELFHEIGCELIPHDQNNQEDRGIDWIYEIIKRDTQETVLRFNIQNKGSFDEFKRISKNNHPEKGKISWQLKKLRHAKYFCYELAEPLIILTCDLNSKSIYWHPIQLEEDINKRIIEQEKKNIKSIQIYIDPRRRISNRTIKEFVNDINDSRIEQTIKLEKKEINNLQIVQKSFPKRSSKRSVLLELEKTFKESDGLISFPPHVLPRLYPFALNKDSDTYYSSFSLYTDNKRLYDFFDNIKIEKGKVFFKEKDAQTQNLKDYSKRIKDIVRLLQHNLVDHLILQSKRSKRVCIHKLFTYSSCDCVRCTFSKLDFLNAKEKVEEKLDNKDNWEDLKSIYIFYQFGLFKKAYELYKEKAKVLKKQKKYLAAFICLYNLKKLSIYLRGNYFKDDREAIMEDLKKIDLDHELARIKNKITDENYEILKWTKEDKFINRAIWGIEDTLEKIMDFYESDHSGGWSNNSKYSEFINYIAQVSVFLGGNLIIYDNFSEFKRIVHKAFEGSIAMYSIQNPESSKIKSFNDYIFNLVLYYADDTRLRKILGKYELIELTYKRDAHLSLSKLTEKTLNFFDSISAIQDICLLESEYPNYFFKNKCNQIFKNILVLYSRITIPKKEFNSFYSKLIQFLKEAEFIYGGNERLFRELFNLKKTQINVQNLKKLFHLMMDEKFHDDRLVRALVKYIDDDASFKNLKNQVLEIYISNLNSVSEIIDAIHSSRYFENRNRNLLKKTIIKRLNSSFNERLYYNSVIFDLIDYKEFLDNYIQAIPKHKNESSFREVFGGKKDNKNIRLNEFINLAYYVGLDLKKEKYQNLSNSTPYYEWLLNIDTFDYSKFNPYWILEYQTSIYFKKFKEIHELKEKIEESLNEKFMKGIAKVYIEIYGKKSAQNKG